MCLLRSLDQSCLRDRVVGVGTAAGLRLGRLIPFASPSQGPTGRIGIGYGVVRTTFAFG